MEGARGSVFLPVGERIYEITPSFKAIVGIERATGRGYRSIGRDVMSGEATLTEIALIVSLLVRSVDAKGPTPDEVGEIIMEYGAGSFTVPVGSFLSRAVIGNKEHQRQLDEEQAAAEARAAAAGEGAGKEADPDPSPGPSRG